VAKSAQLRTTVFKKAGEFFRQVITPNPVLWPA